ncbi:MAG: hypothetical protein V2A53_07415 [bacterium]
MYCKGNIGGSFDHKWKTIQFEIATNTIMATDFDDKKNIFKFKIGYWYYSDYILGELPIDKVKLSTGSDTLEFEEDADGFWSESPDSKFSNLSSTCEYIPGEGAFFPYGMDSGPQLIYDNGTGTKDDYQIIEDNNLNCRVLGGTFYLNWYSAWSEYPSQYTWDDPGIWTEAGFDEHLSMAKAHNLKIIPDFLDDTRSGQIAYRHGSEEACLDYLQQVMYDHKDDPNILFWWLKDEWDHEYDTFGSPHLFVHQVSQRQRLADPNRPGFLLGMGFMGLTEWKIMAEDADVLSCDQYPSDYKNVEKGLAMQAQRLDEMRKAVGNTRPLIMTGEFPGYPPLLGRIYTKDEIIAQVYTSITHGAVGFLYFAFAHPADQQYDQYGGLKDVWDGVKQGGYELLKAPDKLADVILPPSITLDIMGEKGMATTTTQNMHCIYKQKQNGDKYLITLNAGSTTQNNVSWKLSDLAGTASKTLVVLFETRTVTAINGTFTDTYKGYERHVYKITEAPKPKITLKKTSDKKYVAKEGTLTYTITYTNEGSGTAMNVSIIEVLPENTLLQNATGNPSYYVNSNWQSTPSPSATKIKWLISQVSPASSGTVSFTCEVR